MKKLAFILLLVSCKKEFTKPIQHDITCKCWEGIWWSESFKDSLVIKFDKQIKDTVYYKGNIKLFDGYLKHSCPYKWTSDNLILNVNGVKYEFRYSH